MSLQDDDNIENNNQKCPHEWKLLDLGTGDYNSYYCYNCSTFEADVEE